MIERVRLLLLMRILEGVVQFAQRNALQLDSVPFCFLNVREDLVELA